MKRQVRAWLRCLLIVWLAGCASVAHAHKSSDSYLTLAATDTMIKGRWDVALRDLDAVMDLDADRDRQLSWGEVRARLDSIDRYVLSSLAIAGDDAPCALAIEDHRIDTHTDGSYLVFDLRAACEHEPRTVAVKYSLLFDVDPTHRGLLKLGLAGAEHAAIFAPESASARFDAAAGHSRTFLAYLVDGFQHILAGYDHLLFLCSLLLPAVAIRRSGRWEACRDLRPVMFDVARTVTAFTFAHTITLGLAAFDIVALPSRLVESAIALSVVLAALNNLFCVVQRRRWLVAFGFGLIHGFGFAAVLAGLELQGTGRVLALFGFNLGVEVGQLAIVFVLLPVLYLIRETTFYRRAVLAAGSCAIAGVAAYWLVERAFDLRIAPFT